MEKVDVIIKNYWDYVIEGLNYFVYMVCDFCFGELVKCLVFINGFLVFFDNVDLLVYIICFLDDDSIFVKEVSKIFINVVKYDLGFEFVF